MSLLILKYCWNDFLSRFVNLFKGTHARSLYNGLVSKQDFLVFGEYMQEAKVKKKNNVFLSFLVSIFYSAPLPTIWTPGPGYAITFSQVISGIETIDFVKSCFIPIKRKDNLDIQVSGINWKKLKVVSETRFIYCVTH